MLLRIVYIILIKLLLAGSILAQDFSVTQKRLIASKIDELLENYQKYGGLSEDGIAISALYVKKLNDLFTGTKDVYLYNEIDP
jgi:capsid portal protein